MQGLGLVPGLCCAWGLLYSVAAYLTAAAFKTRTLAPPDYVDAIEAETPGWTDAQLLAKSRWLDAKLAKRYAAPFASPYPECLLDWLTRIVTWRCYIKRGVDPTDREVAEVKADAELAEREADNAVSLAEAHFELPLRENTTASGATVGRPMTYTESTPYAWTDVQLDAALGEQQQRSGTRG